MVRRVEPLTRPRWDFPGSVATASSGAFGLEVAMSKLDEIEKELDRFHDGRLPIENQHIDLLIRAVRQLGREYIGWYSSRPDLAVERIDRDILELVEGDDHPSALT